MSNNGQEIFPNPTVTKVIFQIKFSNLYLIESKIGDIQAKIMEKYPESSLNIRRQILFADIGSGYKPEDLPPPDDLGRKIWNFKSEENYVLNITTNSLDISSVKHKSFYPSNEDEGFRDIINFTMKHFLDIIPIQKLKRIGLRYIDDCPILSKEKNEFKRWYNTSLPIDRFKLEDAESMGFMSVVKRGDIFLIFRENFSSKEDKLELFLDFDAYAENIKVKDYPTILDRLYSLNHNEWELSINDPVKEYMRKNDDSV